MLRKTDRDIKCISYQLSNIVSNGENHIIIQSKSPKAIEVIEDTPIYAKIPCSGYNSPCRIGFEYISKGDIKVFVSLSNKFPSPEDCSKAYNKVKRF